MNDEQKLHFFSRIVLAIRQAGMVAKSFQGKVQNEGKVAEGFETDSEILKMKRAAKTVIDEVVQEILLIAIKDILDPKKITIDAEEETPSLPFFSNKNAEISIVIDPIDGTFEYLNGSDSYSVCLGVVEKNKVTMAFVYFPARDDFYFLANDGESYRLEDFSVREIKDAKPIVTSEKEAPKRVYKNSRVSEEIIDSFMSADYEVLDDTMEDIGCPDAIIKLLDGESRAYIAHSRNMRDILQGAIVGNADGYFMSDWKGNELEWPKAGRVPRALFGVEKFKDEIVKLINQ